jgi:hypothetical protein
MYSRVWQYLLQLCACTLIYSCQVYIIAAGKEREKGRQSGEGRKERIRMKSNKQSTVQTNARYSWSIASDVLYRVYVHHVHIVVCRCVDFVCIHGYPTEWFCEYKYSVALHLVWRPKSPLYTVTFPILFSDPILWKNGMQCASFTFNFL